MGFSRLLFNMCITTNVCNITNITYIRRQSHFITIKHNFTMFDILFIQLLSYSFLLQEIIGFFKPERLFDQF
jgi:hypothetical protein